MHINPHKMPNNPWELWGCKVGIEFPVVKLLEYLDCWSDLEASDNPFAVCTMAHLKTLETKGDFVSKRRWKVNLVRRLYGQGRDRQYVIDLFRFIDWIMALPEELSMSFWEEIRQLEEEHSMPYVTSVERIGIKKGIEQGIQQGVQQGTRDLLKRQLELKFGPLSPDILARLNEARHEQLMRWSERILTAKTLAEVFGD